MRSRLGLPKDSLVLSRHSSTYLGRCRYLLDITAEKHSADFVLVDMNPSLSSINQNLLMISDFFTVPASPDYFSVMAVESLSTVVPRWHAWSRARKVESHSEICDLSVSGQESEVHRYHHPKIPPRKGSPTEGFQKWIDTINERMAKQLVPL